MGKIRNDAVAHVTLTSGGLSMKKNFALAAMAATTIFAAPARAAVVFESFANYANAGDTNIIQCSSCGGAGSLLASFSLSSQQTLNKAFVLVTSNPTESMTVSIFNDGGNDLPTLNNTGGILNPILFLTYTNPTSSVSVPGNVGNGGNFLQEFALPDWQLAAGKYWIRFAGASNVLPNYATATPGNSRVIGTDFFLEGRPVVYNPADRAIGFSLNAVSVSVAAVPEPATWGMMLLGFGLVGSTMRRRNATRAVALA